MSRSRLSPLALALAALAPALALAAAEPQNATPGIPAAYRLLQAQPSPAGFPALDNAALLYYQVFLQIDRKALDAIKPENAAEDWTPDAKSIELLEASAGAIATTVRASQLDRCDWGFEYALGWNVLLPQLGPFRTLARTLDADTRRLISSRGVAASPEIAARLAAMLRMGDHVSQNPILIGSLVGVAVSSLGVAAVDNTLNAKALDAAGRDTVLAAARSLLTDDPFHMKAALQAERTLSVKSLELARTDPGAPLAQGVEAVLRQSARTADFSKLDPAVHAKNLGLLDAAYQRLLDAWDQPDAPDLLSRFSADLEQGVYGPYAQVLFPAINNARRGSLKAVNSVKALITRLEQYTPPAAAKP